MASTRNINTRGNYNIEMNKYKHSATYTLYENSQYGSAYDTRLAGNGVNPGAIPWNKLSNNAADIESFLFGINLTDLTTTTDKVLYPELLCLETQNFYQKQPTIIPEPLIIEKNQRPYPTP
jgi:hypothetical protein